MIIDTVTVTEIMIVRDSSIPGDRENKKNQQLISKNSTCIYIIVEL